MAGQGVTCDEGFREPFSLQRFEGPTRAIEWQARGGEHRVNGDAFIARADEQGAEVGGFERQSNLGGRVGAAEADLAGEAQTLRTQHRRAPIQRSVERIHAGADPEVTRRNVALCTYRPGLSCNFHNSKEVYHTMTKKIKK